MVLCSDVVLESGSILESDLSPYFEDSDSDSNPLDSDSNLRTRSWTRLGRNNLTIYFKKRFRGMESTELPCGICPFQVKIHLLRQCWWSNWIPDSVGSL